jgi:hypothetical protein
LTNAAFQQIPNALDRIEVRQARREGRDFLNAWFAKCSDCLMSGMARDVVPVLPTREVTMTRGPRALEGEVRG